MTFAWQWICVKSCLRRPKLLTDPSPGSKLQLEAAWAFVWLCGSPQWLTARWKMETAVEFKWSWHKLKCGNRQDEFTTWITCCFYVTRQCHSVSGDLCQGSLKKTWKSVDPQKIRNIWVKQWPRNIWSGSKTLCNWAFLDDVRWNAIMIAQGFSGHCVPSRVTTYTLHEYSSYTENPPKRRNIHILRRIRGGCTV